MIDQKSILQTKHEGGSRQNDPMTAVASYAIGCM